MNARLKLIFGVVVASTLSFSSFAKEQITVFAAASLTNAMTDIGKQFDKTHDTDTRFSFASSSTLARQIEQGAPAELFLSANQKWMDYLQQQHSIDSASRITLLHNALVMIAPQARELPAVVIDAKLNVVGLVGDSRIAVGDPDHVPAGRYAKESLETLGLWASAEPLLARANNVRAALALVERGEASIGIVYATDAQISDKVKTVAEFPSSSHKPIAYPVALTSSAPSPAAKALYDYLQTAEAKAVFAKYGFKVD
ncbi:molybdate ABC transporter substrate-binding protein [Shewanella avicenniae]|uniref:Molybdate ABC transporter substrate-binding protein n=1 Tax=Shewanella avicenniae TaxID=2814294 RepID=A0ABX7QR78_9GAMM|nr:molybdate ABC transporter substrate-binding protein [Shewanella avicenniae]QSX33769.1 molybdate ABC transporter substrate-binding protein [Shewanella avicenniae]